MYFNRKVILNCNTISQYYIFYCIFDQINAAFVSRRDRSSYFEMENWCYLLKITNRLELNRNRSQNHYISGKERKGKEAKYGDPYSEFVLCI